MRRSGALLVTLLLASWPVLVVAQSPPSPAATNAPDLDKLLENCVRRGGLRLVEGTTPGRKSLEIADPSRLEEAVALNITLLGPSVREALIDRIRLDTEEAPALIAVLRDQGRFTSDDRALGYAAWSGGRRAARRLRLAEAAHQFAEAARRFLLVARDWLRDQEVRALVRRCVRAGALREADGPDGHRIELASPEVLSRVVSEARATLTPSLRESLVRRLRNRREPETPALIALLKAVGEASGDRRVLAEGSQAAAFHALRRGDQAGALAQLQDAAGHFAAIGDGRSEASCHTMIGMQHSGAGRHGQALVAYHASLAILRKIRGKDDFSLGMALIGVGHEYLKLGEYDRAAEHLEQAVAMFEGLRGEFGRPAELSMAVALNNLALVASARFEFDRAIALQRRVLAIKRAAYGDRHPEVAFTLTNLGAALADRGDHLGASEHYRRALEVQEAILTPGDWRIAMSHHNLGSSLSQLGRFGDALEQHEIALAMLRNYYGPEHAQVASSLENLGSVHEMRGDYERALEFLNQALAMRRKAFGDRHPAVADSLAELAHVHRLLGDIGRALQEEERTLAIRRSTLGDGHPSVGASLNNIALLRSLQGDHPSAYALLRRSLDLQRPAYGDKHPEILTIRENLADELAELGRPSEALEEYVAILGVRRAIFGEAHPAVAGSIQGIAGLRSQLGDRERAIKDYDRALEIRRSVQGPRHPDTIRTLYNQAVVLRQGGRPADALRRIDEALVGSTLGDGSGDFSVSSARPERLRPLTLTVSLLSLRGKILAEGPEDVGRLRESAGSLELAAAVLDRARVETIRSEAGRLLAGEDSHELYPRLIGVRRRLAALEGRPDHLLRAVEASESGRARVFLESFGRSKADGSGEIGAELRAREKALDRRALELDVRIEEESNRPVERRDYPLIARLIEERAAVGTDRDRFIEGLERDHPRYAALKYPRPCPVEEARACLAEDEAALVFEPGAATSYLIVLEKHPDPGTPGVAIFDLPPAGEVAELVAALTAEKTLEVEGRTRSLGRRAYEMLLGPAAAKIRGKSLVVVAGGAFGRLPLELLVEPASAPDGDGPYLVRGHRVRYAPSLTALHLIDRWDGVRAVPDRTLWALGDPIFQSSDARWKAAADRTHPTGIDGATSDRGPFRRLEASGREVERLRRLMGDRGSDVVLGREASEATVKRLSGDGTLARYRFLHLATHGVLNEGDEIRPSLVLSLVDDPGGQDGLLHPDEVARLRLNADLVVLSACRTGQGNIQDAEGVTGLARSFLHAGSRGVVCSLWQVDDASTADLMVDLYAGLKAGLPSADALRSAQLGMIEAGEPPLHWAPFILIGR
jgi:CHAT domain-containing protein/tetratricopeptide (TPR) repeat protein